MSLPDTIISRSEKRFREPVRAVMKLESNSPLMKEMMKPIWILLKQGILTMDTGGFQVLMILLMILIQESRKAGIFMFTSEIIH